MPIKPTEKEEAYFVRMEFERKKKIERSIRRSSQGRKRSGSWSSTT